MISFYTFIFFVHIIGLAIGVGAATVKLVILIKARQDNTIVPYYLKVAKPITQLIIFGIVLLTISGIGFIIEGYPLTTQLTIKLIFVALLWIIGPIIDNAIEPEFIKSAPAIGDQPTQEFTKVHKKYLTLEILATLIFYIVIVIWIFGEFIN
jgi:hypothetical protein